MINGHSAQQDPPAPAGGGTDWPPLPSLNTKCWFETELDRVAYNAGDQPYLVLKVKGEIPLNYLTDFEYQAICSLEKLFREKALTKGVRE